MPPPFLRTGRTVFGVAAAIAVIIIIVGGLWSSYTVLPLALSIDTSMANVRQLSSAEFGTSAPNDMSELQNATERILGDVKPAARASAHASRFSPALAWLHSIDKELYAWSVQLKRIETDLRGTSALLSSYTELLEGYDQVQDLLRTPVDARSDGNDLASRTESILVDLTVSRKLSNKFRPAIHTTQTRNTLVLLNEVERKLILAARVGSQGAHLLKDLTQIGVRARRLTTQFTPSEGGQETLTFGALESTVAEIDQLVHFAAVKTVGLGKLTSHYDAGGNLSDRITTLQDVLEIVSAINGATMLSLQAVGPALQELSNSEAGLITGDNTLQKALTSIQKHDSELGEALNLLEAAGDSLSQFALRGESIDGLIELERVVERLASGLRLVREMAPVGLDMIGNGETKRYLVLGQSSDELRATGGFVSAVWLITFENGSIADIRYHDSIRVDDWDRLALYPPPPLGLEEHMNARVWLIRDVSWEPDFPSTARMAADMYRLGQRHDVDGVFALNQLMLLSIIQAINNVPAPRGGPPITSRNLLTKLEEGSDQHGRAYIDLALQGVLKRLDGSMSIGTLVGLAAAIGSSLEQRNLLIYLDNPESQIAIQRNGWDGSVADSPHDYLYVVDSNVGWTKSDRNVERKITYRVDLTRPAGPRIGLTLSYNNYSGAGSTGCVPQWLNRGNAYGQLKNACYWNYWRVYAPPEAKFLSNTPLNLPEYSVAVEIGKRQPGEDSVHVSSSLNKAVYSGLFSLEAGKARDVSLSYDLPLSTLRQQSSGIGYSLMLQKQPGIKHRDVYIEFILPDNYGLSNSSTPPVSTQDGRIEFFLRVEKDTILEATFVGNHNVSN